jgi:hypothetical protein
MINYAPKDLNLSKQPTYYKNKGKVLETMVKRENALNTAKQGLIDQDILRMKQGSAPATPQLGAWLKKTNEVKIDNELMSKGQFPIYSKPNRSQLESMHSINQETRQKPSPDTKSLEISLRQNEAEDRTRILNGEMPTHRKPSVKELKHIGSVLNERQLKASIKGTNPAPNLVLNVGKDIYAEEKVKVNLGGMDLMDDKKWAEQFSDINPIYAPVKPVSYNESLRNTPVYPGSSGTVDDAFKLAADWRTKELNKNSPYYNTPAMVSSLIYTGSIPINVLGMFGQALGFSANYAIDLLGPKVFGTDFVATKSVMEANRELPWQVTNDYMDKKIAQMESVYKDPEWNDLPLSEKLAPGNILKTIQYTVPDVAASIAAFSVGGWSAIAASSANNMYETAQKYGVSKRQSYTLGIMSGLGEAALEKIGFDQLFKSAPGLNVSVVKKMANLQGLDANAAASLVRQGLSKRIAASILSSEAVTEGLQNVWQKSLERTFRDDLGWDEFASTTILSMVGGAVADAALRPMKKILTGLSKSEYEDMEYAKATMFLLDNASKIGNDPNLTKEAAFRESVEARANAGKNPLAGMAIKERRTNPLNPSREVNNLQQAKSVRTGETIYVKSSANEMLEDEGLASETIRIIPDVMGHSYDEYESGNIRAMDYDQAVNYITENMQKELSKEEQELAREILEGESDPTAGQYASSWGMNEVARVMGMMSDPNKYDAVLLRDDVRGTVVSPFGIKYVQKVVNDLAIRDSMMLEMLNDMKDNQENSLWRNFTKQALEIQKLDEKNPNVFETRLLQIKDTIDMEDHRALKIRKNINVQAQMLSKFKEVNKAYTNGFKLSWKQAKNFFTRMANGKTHNIVEVQKFMYGYMIKNPLINKQFTAAGKDSIVKRIINLSTKKTDKSMQKALNSIITSIDEKMNPAKVKAIMAKAVSTKTLKNAKLDWEGRLADWNRFKELPNLIKAMKILMTVEPTEAGLKELEALVDEQRTLYEDSKERMNEIMEQRKMDQFVISSGLIEDIKTAKVTQNSKIIKAKFLDQVLASPMLRASNISQQFENTVVLETFKDEQEGNKLLQEVGTLKDQFGLMAEKLKMMSVSLSGKQSTISKHGVEIEITATADNNAEGYKFSKAELISLYLSSKDPGSRYALVGEKGSSFQVSRDGNSPTMFFYLSESQLKELEQMVENDPEMMNIVDFTTEFFQLCYEAVSKVYKYNTGKDLPYNTNYIPMQIWGNLSDKIDESIANGSAINFSGMEAALGMLKDRKHMVQKVVKTRDIFAITNTHMRNSQLYSSYGKLIKRLTRLMKSIDKDMAENLGESEVKYWNTYIKNLNPFAQINTSDPLSKTANWISRQATRSILWGKITTILSQPASYLAIASVDPEFGLTDMIKHMPSSSKFFMNKNMNSVLEGVFPMLYTINLTQFDPTLNNDMVAANDFLSVLEEGKLFAGRGMIEKVSHAGMKPMMAMNNFNFNAGIFSYLSTMAEKEGAKPLNEMTLNELDAFATKHKDGALRIIMGSQPLYGMANRPSALAGGQNYLAKALLTFKSASIANVNGARRAWRLYRDGKISFVNFSAMFSSAMLIPAMWMSLVKMLYDAFKEWLSPEDEASLRELEGNSNLLIRYAQKVTETMVGQVPLLGELLWGVQGVLNGKANPNSDLIKVVPIQGINQFAQSIAAVAKELSGEDEADIDKIIDSAIKIIDLSAGINLSEPRKLYNLATQE